MVTLKPWDRVEAQYHNRVHAAPHFAKIPTPSAKARLSKGCPESRISSNSACVYGKTSTPIPHPSGI
jgi:hypothetical protein